MTLKEFYQEINADYDEIMGRLGNEMLVTRFACKFLEDKSYQMLYDAVEANDYEEAFRGAHTLKGVCQNLGFSNIYRPASELTDCLRNGKHPDNWDLMTIITEEYEKTIKALQKLNA